MESFLENLNFGVLLGSRGIASPSAAITVIGLTLLYVLYVSFPPTNPATTKLTIQQKQATQTEVLKVSFIPSAPDSLHFIGNPASLGGRQHQNDCTIKRCRKAAMRALGKPSGRDIILQSCRHRLIWLAISSGKATMGKITSRFIHTSAKQYSIWYYH